MCVTDRHDMTSAVKVTFNPNTTNQLIFCRYSSIDEVQACAKHVNLPTAKEIEDCETREQPRDNHYETVPSEPLDTEEGDIDDVPPPYPGCSMAGFRPEFLKKDTDFSQAYSNNLYGYKG